MKIVQIGAKVGEGKGIGLGNAGDSAIGTSFDYLLNKEFSNSEIIFLNCRKIFTQDDINLINSADALIISGGGLFLHDTFENQVSDWQWGISEDLLDKIKIPIIVYAVGYNKFRGQREFSIKFNKTINKLVEKSIFFSMRNTGSCEAIKKHLKKENHSKISLNFCPTMLLTELYKIKCVKNKSVGFVLAGDRLENRHKNIEKFGTQIKIFVEYLKSKKYKTILINHQNDTWIKKYVIFDEYIDLFKKESKKIYETYSKIELVVADRGHGQMIPFACGCKLLTPISHNKLKWFLEDLNLEKLGLDESDENLAEKLIEKFEELKVINWEEIFEKNMLKIKKVNGSNLQHIKEKLKVE
jgi:polysaccharide pyruvyl transferase WcaK-like protein